MQDWIRLKPGREKLIKNRHPWIFSGALEAPKQSIANGAVVTLQSAGGDTLGTGFYSPHSQIRLRMLSFGPSTQSFDRDSLRHRIQQAAKARNHLISDNNNMLRLVSHDADFLPGLIIDRYGDWYVFQILSAGMEPWRQDIIAIVRELFQPAGLVERSDETVRRKEGLEPRKEIVFGELPEDGRVNGIENGICFQIDLWHGHKTGFYLDQRDNRHAVRLLAANRHVLNCFSYTGGFSVAALQGGAKSVISLDESRDALAILENNLAMNAVASDCHQSFRVDVFKELRTYQSEGKRFDLIILDPPKFASSQANVKRACRGYKDLNRLAFELLHPGGILITFSCSGLIARDLFQKVVFDASLDANTEAMIIQQLTQSEDHPIRLSFPESFYLKGLVIRKC